MIGYISSLYICVFVLTMQLSKLITFHFNNHLWLLAAKVLCDW